ncbi:unnamed protein product [Vicia faba]|uniref:Uncharacterized protein n=1 Tax=Vicia faba TaxID=3906 RepID=A0AAV0ZPM5_VICFA|nr:unnamed protein product [Vicia faba]
MNERRWGYEHAVEIDLYRWNLFKATCIVKEIIELEHSEYWLWWYNNDLDRYSRMISDSDVDKVYQYVMEMKCVVHIYVEHKGKCNAQEADVGDVQEDDVLGVEQDEVGNDVGGVEHVEVGNVIGVEHVKDERDLGLDDCFGVIENQVEERGKKGRMKVAARKHKHTPTKLQIGVDNVWSSSCMDNEMDINYVSDKLGSSDSNACDGEKKPKYLRFKRKDLDKNYKFKVGLEFV